MPNVAGPADIQDALLDEKLVSVVLVDDDPLVLKALRAYVGQSPKINLLGEFSSAAEALVFLSRNPVDVLVTDVRMPGMTGLELLRKVRAQYPETGVVVLTSFDDDEALLTSLSHHASGFLLKDAAPEEVNRAVVAAAKGGTTISPGPASRLVQKHLRPMRRFADAPVTDSERAVLELLCEGYSNKEIAEELVLEESTVKTHISHLMKKYGVTSRLKLVVVATN